MRSLILAGGGIKVGYQAGCLQVLLDEAGLKFDYVDGASGGCFNVAMLCNGMSGTQIADAWRNMNPWQMVSFNLKEYYKLLWARSIATTEGLRSKVFKFWDLNWDKIRSFKDPIATFNIYNFSEKRLLTLENSQMDEDLLVASVALPMWFPPVIKNGDILFDAVFCTDANVGEAVRRGTDEIWSIWTVADQPEYRNGFLAQYFHIIETSADTKFFRDWEEIAAVNQAIKQHGRDTSRATPDLQLREGYERDQQILPPPGRKPIAQHLIKQEVPIHYLINVSQDRMAETVEMGVRDAREYCRAQGLIKSVVPMPPSRPVLDPPVSMEFTETMKGFFARGEQDPAAGEQKGKQQGSRCDFRVTIHMEDVEKFIRLPEHEARMSGWIDCPSLGGHMDITQGTFNLFVIAGAVGQPNPPYAKQMKYNMQFRDGNGASYILQGIKYVHDDPGFDIWSDLTTLFVTIQEKDRNAQVGAGVLHIHMLDFLHQLTTFRVHNAKGAEALNALNHFGEFFLGSLWDVYARNIIDYAPF